MAGAAPRPVDAFPRPDHTQHAALARWLVHVNDWGTLATLSADGRPSSGVTSFSDGAPDFASGRLFFFLTPMDETAQNIQAHEDCALSVAEAQVRPDGCGSTDPEDPTCAKISVLGAMRLVPEADEEAAAAALFSRHPAMRRWPADHGFRMYELHVREIHMLDYYGGMHVVPGDAYYSASPPSAKAAGPGRRQQPQQQQQQLLGRRQQWLRRAPLPGAAA